jgi:hypothetical protein
MLTLERKTRRATLKCLPTRRPIDGCMLGSVKASKTASHRLCHQETNDRLRGALSPYAGGAGETEKYRPRTCVEGKEMHVPGRNRSPKRAKHPPPTVWLSLQDYKDDKDANDHMPCNGRQLFGRSWWTSYPVTHCIVYNYIYQFRTSHPSMVSSATW